MTQPLAEIWVYLSATPLLFLTLTLLVYQGAYWIYRRADFHPLLNPVAISVAILVVLLALTGTPYETYFGGAQFVHFLLGPATVALAVPLYAQLGKLKRALWPICRGAAGGRRDGPGVRRRHRVGARRQRADVAVDRAEVRDDADRDGHRRAARRPAVADRGAGGLHRHHRRGRREVRARRAAASPTRASAASRSAPAHTGSAPRVRSRKATKLARSPGSRWACADS